MKSLTVKIALIAIIAANLCACASVIKNFPKKDRPFEKRSFDSKIWIEGDAQTRGEMLKNFQWNEDKSKIIVLRDKSQGEIVRLLGEPDKKTSGKCCGVPRTREVEVWLYNVETQNESSKKTESEHFQIYFTEEGKVDEFRVAEWDEKDPDYVPRIG
jgi:hypothetical protein